MAALRLLAPLRRFSAAAAATGNLQEQFARAVALSKKLPEAPDMEKLKLYALFKQASEGDNSSPKPGMFDIKGKYKWEAWAELKGMSKDDAMRKYADAINTMAGGADSAGSAAQPATAATGKYENLHPKKSK